MIAQLVSWTIDGIVLSAITDFTLAQPGIERTKNVIGSWLCSSNTSEKSCLSVDEGIKMEYVTIAQFL